MNYLNEIVNLTPRVLTLLDRNRFSPTYGCFDRDYWHYKIVRDFPSSIFQQGILSLVLLYKNDFSGNIYYKNKNIIEWILAGLLFWSRIQNKDGSFNEWFPNEHSHVATAFSSYAVSETLLLLKDELTLDVKERLINNLSLAGKWLAVNKDRLVINHTTGAVMALYNIYLLTGDKRFLKAVEDNIDIVVNGQDSEGWFSEYGGADIGYLSISIDYLAKYFKKTKDLRVEEILDKAVNFLSYFIHTDGTSGGVYGSRNTQYIMPHGFVILAPYFCSARYILKSIWPRLGERLNMFDDRYFLFFVFPNIIHANLDFREDLLEYSGNNFNNYCKVFKNAGLVSIKNGKYHFICNIKKGGVFNIFSNDRLALSDSGYLGTNSKGQVFASQWLDRGMVIDDIGMAIVIERPLALMNNKTLTFKNLLLLRLFNFTICRVGRFAQVFDRYIKKKRILSNKRVPIFLRRRIDIKGREILVEDSIDASRTNIKFSKFGLGMDEVVMHVPSSVYFQKEILGAYIQRINLKEELNLKKRCSVVQRIRFNDYDSTPEVSIEKVI